MMVTAAMTLSVAETEAWESDDAQVGDVARRELRARALAAAAPAAAMVEIYSHDGITLDAIETAPVKIDPALCAEHHGEEDEDETMTECAVVGVDAIGVTVRHALGGEHHVAWWRMRDAGASLPPLGALPRDVEIHAIYAPLLSEARRMAAEAGLSRVVEREDGPELWDPDEVAWADECDARQRAHAAEYGAIRAALRAEAAT